NPRPPPPRRDTQHAPCHESPELGGVPEPVVRGERTAVAFHRDPIVDEGADGDVLAAVPGTADEVAGDHDPEEEEDRGDGDAKALDPDGDEARGGEARKGDVRGD